MDNQPHLIYYQGPANNPNPSLGALDRTDSILENLDHIESLPLDGIVVNVPAAWFMMKDRSLDYEEYFAKWLRPLEGKLQNLDQNFLLAQIDRPGDPFDDWGNTLDNWRKMARAAKEFGYKGIFFDNEEYEGRILNYPNDLSYTDRYSLDQYRNQMRSRGRQIMKVITDEFPDIVLFNNRGPYKSVANLPDYVKSDSSDEVELLGSLFVGFLEGATPQSTVIDGGQIYDYRSETDFELSYNWRKQDIASEEVENQFIPQDIKNDWSNKVDVSFGVFNQPHPRLDEELGDMTPAILESTLTNALNTGDEYVWLYAEQDSWLTPGGVGQAWIDATAQAQNNSNGFSPENSPSPNPSPSNSGITFGTNDRDNLFGTDNSDNLDGLAGNDRLEGRGGSDRIDGDKGFDTLVGGSGDDTIIGDDGGDVLEGGNNNDILFGNSGYDRLFGQQGRDRLVGGKGLDTLVGGGGSDSFVLKADSGADTIVDFQNGEDVIILAGGLQYGNLSFSFVDGNTVIKNNQETLATLLEINPEAIDRNDFVVE